jgi:hypothetical protein
MTPQPDGDGRSWRLDADTSILVAVYVVVAAVAAFAFGQSYTHIYDLGRRAAQRGWTATLLPLSVDLLIVAATLVMAWQRRQDSDPSGLARWLPRAMLYAGIGATIAANIGYGLPYGDLAAGISAWPGAVFAGLVETVMVAVRPRRRGPGRRAPVTAGQPAIPATVLDAAKAAHAASLAAGNPLSGFQLHKRFGVSRAVGDKIAAAGRAAANGDGPHG